MKVQEYVLDADHNIWYGSETKVIPQGSFVKPINLAYVPQHVKDDSRWKFIRHDVEVFCYSRFGIVAIPRRIIRELK